MGLALRPPCSAANFGAFRRGSRAGMVRAVPGDPDESRARDMSLDFKSAVLGLVAAGFVLAAPAAHAFTVENKDAVDQYGVPKFDIEEQAKHFRNGGTATPGKQSFETPLGTGTLQFGVGPGPAFGPGGMGFGPATGSRASRADFERMLAPPNMRDMYDR